MHTIHNGYLIHPPPPESLSHLSTLLVLQALLHSLPQLLIIVIVMLVAASASTGRPFALLPTLMLLLEHTLLLDIIKHDPLRPDELPRPGTLVAIDAEFVSMQQVLADH